jgi:hypothetical protein
MSLSRERGYIMREKRKMMRRMEMETTTERVERWKVSRAEKEEQQEDEGEVVGVERCWW